MINQENLSNREVMAHHEAGHAIASHAYGYPVFGRVNHDNESGMIFTDTRALPNHMAVMLMAGIVAEKNFKGQYIDFACEYWEGDIWNGTSDHAQLFDLGLGHAEPYDAVVKETQTLLKKHEVLHLAIANHLVEHGVVDTDTIHELSRSQ